MCYKSTISTSVYEKAAPARARGRIMKRLAQYPVLRGRFIPKGVGPLERRLLRRRGGEARHQASTFTLVLVRYVVGPDVPGPGASGCGSQRTPVGLLISMYTFRRP